MSEIKSERWRHTRVVEWSVKLIDKYGDALDDIFFCGPGCASRAKSHFEKWEPYEDEIAVVLERVTHNLYGREDQDPEEDELENSDYEVIATNGDRAALLAGGWIGNA